MKKTGLYLGLLSMLLVMACKEKEVVHDTVETNNETENVATEPADTVIVKAVDEAPDGTSIKIDGDGVSVKNKDGEKALDVDVQVKK